jgi:hypothetical protein
MVAAAAAPSLIAHSSPVAPTAQVSESSYVGTATVETKGMPSKSDGDLWPSCWAGNGNLYAANGDGKGFSLDDSFADIAVSEIQGDVTNSRWTSTTYRLRRS